MEPFRDYLGYDAVGLADLVRRKEVHPLELVEAAIERIELVNPRVNAVIDRLYARARAAAARPLGEQLFAGVPYLLKDMVTHAGTRLTLGSKFLRAAGFVPDTSHEVVARSERAGLIILGKTNACEFGLLPFTEPEAYGPTANPWSLDHSPGGSSGGAAAAVAAGMVPMAHANDGGGSIRYPASTCGVFGLKPSRGRNPGDEHDSPDGIAVQHCVSRSVRDSAALLDVTGGPQPGDRFWAPPPARPYRDEVSSDPGTLRIAFSVDDFCNRPAHPECQEAVRAAALLCESLGHHVEERRPAVDGARFNEAFAALWASMAAAMFPMLLQDAKKNRLVASLARIVGDRAVLEVAGRVMMGSLESPVEPLTRRFAAIGEKVSHAAYQVAAIDLNRASYEMARFLESFDCFLTPVLAQPPMRTGALAHLDIEQLREELLAYTACTPICNVAGLPAMSVPLHWTEAGLPVGVHFMGRFGDEATLFRLAGQLESAQPWANRWPADMDV